MDDEWTTVTKSSRNRSGQKRNQKRRNFDRAEISRIAQITEKTPMTLKELDSFFDKFKFDLLRASFFEKFRSALFENPTASSVVCYGIGNFGEKKSSPTPAQWQLAFVLTLMEKWKPDVEKPTVYYFEPLMTDIEAKFLESQSIKIIPNNERACRLVDDTTFFFMPHCPLSLYSNLLLTNVKDLGKVLLFGNSLTTYANRLQKNCHTTLLKYLESHWNELDLTISKEEIRTMSGDFEQAFNDSVFLCFPSCSSIDIPTSLKDEIRLGGGGDEAI